MSIVLVGVVGWAAGRATLTPPALELPAAQPVTYTVDEGTLGRGFDFSATAEWQVVRTSTNSAAGTVTDVGVEPGQTIRSGQVIYRVDERPVVVARGAVPQYRRLAVGDVGRDVTQLQRFLADLGYYSAEATGTFGTLTRSAVQAWQRANGVPDDGVVAAGALVFLDRLPTRVNLAESISVGAQVSPGVEAVQVLSTAPRFTMTLSDEQLDSVPPDARVRVSSGEATWNAVVASVRAGDPGETVLVLEGGDGRPVCRQECEQYVDTDGPQRMRAVVVVVPRTTGPVVPAAAIWSDADGDTFVTLDSGEQRAVTVLASDSGNAVVDGVDVGVTIRLFGTGQDGTDTASAS